MAKTGRRPGPSRTRATILQVARGQFAERGYGGTTIRSVAAEAGVHPALLHHYFGTKQVLYRDAFDFPVDTWAVLDRLLEETPREDFAEALTRHYVATWRATDTGSWLRATTRQMLSEPAGTDPIRMHWNTVVVPRIATALGIPEARAAAAVAFLIGISLADSIVNVSALTDLSDDELVDLVSPMLDRSLRSAE